MAGEVFGWCGKILKVDLSTEAIICLDTMGYARLYLGGRGIATRIYWEEVAPSVRAFDPQNCLIFMTGPLGATGAPGASRFVVAGKSPMTCPEGFCHGNLGGHFGAALKAAGYDGLIVTGAAPKPVYLFVDNDRVQIMDASDLWGKGAYATATELKQAHGERVRFVTTGTAGENRCRTATLLTDHEGSATGGFGAVMGAKNLKAIALKGTGRPATARPDELVELVRLAFRLGERGKLLVPLPREQIRKVGGAPCHQCGFDCFRGKFRLASGREVIRKCQSLLFYMPWVTGRTGESLETAVDATALCNDLSLCTMEMDNLIRWLVACNTAGVITGETTGLDMSQVGSARFFEALAVMIAHRIGFGNLLAEGLLRAGRQLGEEARSHFTEEVSDVGLGASYSGREYIPNALLYSFEPRQPMAMLHEVSFLIARWLLHRLRPDLSPTSAEVFRSAARKFWGSDAAGDLTTYEGKALAATKIQDRTYAKESLVLCDFAWPIMDSLNTPDHVGDPTLESRLVSAATGIDVDEAGLHRYGERIFNLQRAVLLREGREPVTGDAPAPFNFSKQVQSDPLNPHLLVPGPGEEPVSVKGSVLDRKKFEEMRREFYIIRGWAPESGLQTRDTLETLRLSDVADALEALGKLAD